MMSLLHTWMFISALFLALWAHQVSCQRQYTNPIVDIDQPEDAPLTDVIVRPTVTVFKISGPLFDPKNVAASAPTFVSWNSLTFEAVEHLDISVTGLSLSGSLKCAMPSTFLSFLIRNSVLNSITDCSFECSSPHASVRFDNVTILKASNMVSDCSQIHMTRMLFQANVFTVKPNPSGPYSKLNSQTTPMAHANISLSDSTILDRCNVQIINYKNSSVLLDNLDCYQSNNFALSVTATSIVLRNSRFYGTVKTASVAVQITTIDQNYNAPPDPSLPFPPLIVIDNVTFEVKDYVPSTSIIHADLQISAIASYRPTTIRFLNTQPLVRGVIVASNVGNLTLDVEPCADAIHHFGAWLHVDVAFWLLFPKKSLWRSVSVGVLSWRPANVGLVEGDSFIDAAEQDAYLATHSVVPYVGANNTPHCRIQFLNNITTFQRERSANYHLELWHNVFHGVDGNGIDSNDGILGCSVVNNTLRGGTQVIRFRKLRAYNDATTNNTACAIEVRDNQFRGQRSLDADVDVIVDAAAREDIRIVMSGAAQLQAGLRIESSRAPVTLHFDRDIAFHRFRRFVSRAKDLFVDYGPLQSFDFNELYLFSTRLRTTKMALVTNVTALSAARLDYDSLEPQLIESLSEDGTDLVIRNFNNPPMQQGQLGTIQFDSHVGNITILGCRVTTNGGNAIVFLNPVSLRHVYIERCNVTTISYYGNPILFSGFSATPLEDVVPQNANLTLCFVANTFVRLVGVGPASDVVVAPDCHLITGMKRIALWQITVTVRDNVFDRGIDMSCKSNQLLLRLHVVGLVFDPRSLSLGGALVISYDPHVRISRMLGRIIFKDLLWLQTIDGATGDVLLPEDAARLQRTWAVPGGHPFLFGDARHQRVLIEDVRYHPAVNELYVLLEGQTTGHFKLVNVSGKVFLTNSVEVTAPLVKSLHLESCIILLTHNTKATHVLISSTAVSMSAIRIENCTFLRNGPLTAFTAGDLISAGSTNITVWIRNTELAGYISVRSDGPSNFLMDNCTVLSNGVSTVDVNFPSARSSVVVSRSLVSIITTNSSAVFFVDNLLKTVLVTGNGVVMLNRSVASNAARWLNDPLELCFSSAAPSSVEVTDVGAGSIDVPCHPIGALSSANPPMGYEAISSLKGLLGYDSCSLQQDEHFVGRMRTATHQTEDEPFTTPPASGNETSTSLPDTSSAPSSSSSSSPSTSSLPVSSLDNASTVAASTNDLTSMPTTSLQTTLGPTPTPPQAPRSLTVSYAFIMNSTDELAGTVAAQMAKQLGLDGSSAEAIIVTGQAAGGLAGVLNPVAANKANSGGRLFVLAYCQSSSEEEASYPSWSQFFLPIAIGSGTNAKATGALLMTSLLILGGVGSWFGIMMWLTQEDKGKATSTLVQKTARYLGVLVALLVNYYTPNVIGLSTSMLFIVKDSTAVALFADAVSILSVVVCAVVVLRLGGESVRVMMTPRDGTSKTPSDDVELVTLQTPHAPPSAAADAEQCNHATAVWANGAYAFYDAAKVPDSSMVQRILVLEDAVTAALLAIISGFAEPANCSVLGPLAVIVCAAHCGYLAFVRPYASLAEMVFASAAALMQLLLSLIAAFAPTNESLLPVAAYLMLALNVFLYVQLVVLCSAEAWKYYKRSNASRDSTIASVLLAAENGPCVLVPPSSEAVVHSGSSGSSGKLLVEPEHFQTNPLQQPLLKV